MTENFSYEIERLRFLVVEDQEFQRWNVENTLKSLGAREICTAQDGSRALLAFRTAQPRIDIIVTDLRMPGMDGIEFIRHIAESGMPVAIVLASEQDPALLASVATMTEAYGIQLLETLHKPLTAAKLAGAIANYHGPLIAAEPVDPPREFSVREIESAIANEQFEPYLQPKVDLATGELRGAEALARWRHPLHGTILPQMFIAAVESRGHAHAMTLSILRKAAASCREWRAQGSKATLSVNLSLSSLVDVGLAERLMQAAEDCGLHPHDLIFEVTETAAASHLGRVLENLSRMRMHGFGLAIDDYGTGYSSLQQLCRIPFTELKIDKSFVREAATNRSSRAILESTLEVARKLGISAVAEGVESEQEARMLRGLGYPMAQGYYFGRPVPAAQFDLRNRKRA